MKYNYSKEGLEYFILYTFQNSDLKVEKKTDKAHYHLKDNYNKFE